MKTNDYHQDKICPPDVLNQRNLMIFLTRQLFFHVYSKNLNENDNHTEEVVIGSEQGTTFPTKNRHYNV